MSYLLKKKYRNSKGIISIVNWFVEGKPPFKLSYYNGLVFIDFTKLKLNEKNIF